MRILAIALLLGLFGLSVWLASAGTQAANERARINCESAFRMAAAHYQVWRMVSVEQIKEDARYYCVPWRLK